MELTPNQVDEIRRKSANSKIDAIKQYKDLTGASLKASKDFVESLAADAMQGESNTGDSRISAVDMDRVLDQLSQGNKIEACKIYRNCSGSTLKEAKVLVEKIIHELQVEMPQSKGCGAVLFIASLTLILALSARADEPFNVKVQKDIEFANVEGGALKLDLFVPSDVTTPPLVVWIHGGGWRAGSRNAPKLREVTKHGFALASISYRFTDRAIFPAQIHDCKAAIRWLRANADKYGYNADWIAVSGSSAGGHLALLLGTSGDVAELEGEVGTNLDQSSSVQAVIDYFGPSDFVLRGKTQPERAYTDKSGSFALLGGLRDGKIKPDLESLASPAHYVSADDPPLLIFHGTDDQTVLLDQSQRIVSVYRDAGLSARLVVLPKAGHGGKVFFSDPHLQTALQFLKQHRPAK
ncbi:MAG: alpha/beta hydrolase fold domain-containing protein [Pirellulaceae bacterium]